MDFTELAQRCAPAVHPATMAAVIKVESNFNPFAIGVVGASLASQPKTKEQAVATAVALERLGHNFSIGIGQVNRYNLATYSLTYETAFDPCANLAASAQILKRCFERARKSSMPEQDALRAAFSCYYSGNFQRGFRAELEGTASYVERVLAASSEKTPIGKTPAREPEPEFSRPVGAVKVAIQKGLTALSGTDVVNVYQASPDSTAVFR